MSREEGCPYREGCLGSDEGEDFLPNKREAHAWGMDEDAGQAQVGGGLN